MKNSWNFVEKTICMDKNKILKLFIHFLKEKKIYGSYIFMFNKIRYDFKDFIDKTDPYYYIIDIINRFVKYGDDGFNLWTHIRNEWAFTLYQALNKERIEKILLEHSNSIKETKEKIEKVLLDYVNRINKRSGNRLTKKH